MSGFIERISCVSHKIPSKSLCEFGEVAIWSQGSGSTSDIEQGGEIATPPPR
jgi:hypothetical protein